MIARAGERDLPEILALQRLAFQEEADLVGDQGIKPMVQTLEELRTELKGMLILKYIKGGAILGSVRAYEANGTCYVNRLVVHPEHWGEGIGTALMAEVERHFENASRFELFTRSDHERTRPFYKRLGYLPFKEEKVSGKLTFVFLEKKRTQKLS